MLIYVLTFCLGLFLKDLDAVHLSSFIQVILKEAVYQVILQSELIVVLLAGTVNHHTVSWPPHLGPQQLFG